MRNACWGVLGRSIYIISAKLLNLCVVLQAGEDFRAISAALVFQRGALFESILADFAISAPEETC